MIDELARELAAVGIRGRLRARILAEAAEHVRDGSAEAFGDPKALARRFAEEIGPEEARRAARGSLAALAVAGAAFGLAFVTLTGSGSVDALDGRQAAVGFAAAIGLILLPQVSLAAGVLAPVARSPRTAVRRAAVALGAGAASLGCMLLFAWEFSRYGAALWALAPAGLGLAAAAAPTMRAGRIRFAAAGGNVVDDLGPLVPPPLRSPWRLALAVALVAALATGVAGASGGDPLEGVRNALFESVACLSSFAVSGKYLGLRR